MDLMLLNNASHPQTGLSKNYDDYYAIPNFRSMRSLLLVLLYPAKNRPRFRHIIIYIYLRNNNTVELHLIHQKKKWISTDGRGASHGKFERHVDFRSNTVNKNCGPKRSWWWNSEIEERMERGNRMLWKAGGEFL